MELSLITDELYAEKAHFRDYARVRGNPLVLTRLLTLISRRDWLLACLFICANFHVNYFSWNYLLLRLYNSLYNS
jgi:hypothetical protein